MALDAVVEEDVLPLHAGTHVVDHPRLARAVAGTRNDDADVFSALPSSHTTTSPGR